MSNFAKKLASIRKARFNRIAEVDPKAQAYAQKMSEWGVTIDPENAKPQTKEEAWTSILLLCKSPQGKSWVEGTLMAVNDKQQAIQTLMDKIREVNNDFSDFGAYFSQVSEQKLKEYEMVILPKIRYKGMTGGQSVATWLYGSMNTFYGSPAELNRYSELEDEELEKMAKALTEEFGLKIRAMLASIKK